MSDSRNQPIVAPLGYVTGRNVRVRITEVDDKLLDVLHEWEITRCAVGGGTKEPFALDDIVMVQFWENGGQDKETERLWRMKPGVSKIENLRGASVNRDPVIKQSMLDSLRTAEVFDPSVDCNSPDWTPVDAPHLSLEDHSLDVDTFRELLETLDEELEDSDEEDDEDEDDSEDEEE